MLHPAYTSLLFLFSRWASLLQWPVLPPKSSNSFLRLRIFPSPAYYPPAHPSVMTRLQPADFSSLPRPSSHPSAAPPPKPGKQEGLGVHFKESVSQLFVGGGNRLILFVVIQPDDNAVSHHNFLVQNIASESFLMVGGHLLQTLKQPLGGQPVGASLWFLFLWRPRLTSRWWRHYSQQFNPLWRY